ncbi:MAG: PRC-barrel domain-containing protein, partial [Terriglobales bacterium]
MIHNGSLGTQAASEETDDIRGTEVRGTDNTKLGEVDDVIFDHETMEIRYVIVDGGGWLKGNTFLIPADRIAADPEHKDGLMAGVSRKQIENSPGYSK